LMLWSAGTVSSSEFSNSVRVILQPPPLAKVENFLYLRTGRKVAGNPARGAPLLTLIGGKCHKMQDFSFVDGWRNPRV
jgi:hypothetical protein